MAGGVDELEEAGDVLPTGLAEGIGRNDGVAMDTAGLTAPAVSLLVDVQAVAARIVLGPLREGFSRTVGPVINGFACANAGEGLSAWVLSYSGGGPALLTLCAGDESFVLAEAGDSELGVPGELVTFDGLGAPSFSKLVEVFAAVLVRRDGLLSPLLPREVELCAPLGHLVLLLGELIVDLAWVGAC